MCKIEKILEITPPAFSGRIRGESFISHGHTCPYCSGNGGFRPTQIGHNEYEENLCPICKGSGKLKANIVIGWEPENKQ